MSISLGIDTCTDMLAVALVVDGQLAYSLKRMAPRRHSRELLPEVDRALKTLGLAPWQLTAIGVVSGPGSYTGIRIGMATAEGIARSVGARLMAVPTFAAWTMEAGRPGDTVLAALDARAGLLYCGAYRRLESGVSQVFAENCLTSEEFQQQTKNVAGTRALLGAMPSVLAQYANPTGAGGAAQLAALGGEADDPMVFHPLYVRQAAVRNPSGGRHEGGK